MKALNVEHTPLVDASISVQNGNITKCLLNTKNYKQFKYG